MKLVRFYILPIVCGVLLVACSGSRKYFKVAERLEKQGLVGEAAEYYYEALQRKTTNTDARIKLKEVGQKHVSSLSSEFFRNYNTQQFDASLESYEKMKAFCDKANALNVSLDYPKAYEEDYQKAVEMYCAKNYEQGHMLVNQRKFQEANSFLKKVEKYNPTYKNTKQFSTIATCEPLYQSAINNLENKNYAVALSLLSDINSKADNYKDSKDLLQLASLQQHRTFILFEPKATRDNAVNQIQENLYSNFSQIALDKLNNVQIINNSPFQSAPAATDLSNSNNVDLIQAIRKATGADYFYIYEVSNRKEYDSGPQKSLSKAFHEVRTRVNDSTVTTEYKPIDYYKVKSSRLFSYDYKYKLVNAYSNQIVSSLTQTMKSSDELDYNQFISKYSDNINNLYPYDPSNTAMLQRYNPKAWRQLFETPRTLKSFEELRRLALDQNSGMFSNSAANMR